LVDKFIMRWLIALVVAAGCTREAAPKARLAGEILALGGVGGIVASASLTGVSSDFKTAVLGFSVATLVGLITYAVADITDPANAASETEAEQHHRWAKELTARATDAARAGKCDDVRTLEMRVRGYDAEVHDLVFMRDPDIVRCFNE
jgi:hypothetical protein